MLKRRFSKKLTLMLVALLLGGMLELPNEVSRFVQAEPFATPAFHKVWAQTDQAVKQGQDSHTWFWGPEPGTSYQEVYAESPGGLRLVQYFDKSRMEINNPDADPQAPYFVTNGLLARELVSGRMQIGDSRYTQRDPAQEPVGGDPGNAGPTYASFNALASLNNDHRVQPRSGPVSDKIDRSGKISTITSPNLVSYIYYSEELGHNIPDVFYNQFLQWKTSLGVDWVYVMGLPITEPFWANFKVAGVEKELLVQIYERRALTFTPDNPLSFQVEMSNIGQHYYRWRYNTVSKPPATATPIRTSSTPLAPAPTLTKPVTSIPMPALAPAATPTPVVANAPIYWGAYISTVPWDMTKLDSFEQTINKKVSIVHFGQPWWQSGAYNKFPTYATEQIRLRGSIPMINWGSWDSCCGPNQPSYSLANIYNGTYDVYIRQWATDAKAWGHPLFLRFDHEMNGWWQFPWSERVNANQPGDYVKMWKHVRDIFTQAGATNVTWVWCPNIIGPDTIPLTGLYPGDSYVDWVAMDGYNWGTDLDNDWQSFVQIFRQTYTALSQLAPSKPIMIAEIASSESGGSKAAWIKDAYQVQLGNFPKIKAIVWFNWNGGNPHLSWPIESSQSAINAFKTAIASGYYVAGSSQFVVLPAGPITPLTR